MNMWSPRSPMQMSRQASRPYRLIDRFVQGSRKRLQNSGRAASPVKRPGRCARRSGGRAPTSKSPSRDRREACTPGASNVKVKWKANLAVDSPTRSSAGSKSSSPAKALAAHHVERNALRRAANERRHRGRPSLDRRPVTSLVPCIFTRPDLGQVDNVGRVWRGAHEHELAVRVVALNIGGLEELRDQLVVLAGRGDQPCVLSEPGRHFVSFLSDTAAEGGVLAIRSRAREGSFVAGHLGGTQLGVHL